MPTTETMTVLTPTTDINLKTLEEIEELNRLLGVTISVALQDRSRPIGYCLIMFSFDGPELTYVSNSHRKDMINALKEFIQRAEEGSDDELNRKGRQELNA